MASARSGLTFEGTLYEAVARGNKDTFFFFDDPSKSVNPFDSRYVKVPPTIQELRRIPPLNGADFGRTCEFEFEVAGDVFVAPTILIDLPTWLPSVYAALNNSTLIQDTSGNTYGYTNGIGYFLFSNIQIYQDKILLDEFSGDALFAARKARGSLNSAYLENNLAGVHDGTKESIGFAATPGRLRLELPFLGSGKRGFPSIAMRAQSFKLRLTLRKLEEIVESSDLSGQVAPTPWNLPPGASFIAYTPGNIYPFQPLVRTAIDPPGLQLETRHIYVDGETQLGLQKDRIETPFSRLFENVFTFGPADYAPLDRQAVASVTRRIDARFPSSRLLWFMRSYNDIRVNRLWKFTADNLTKEYYNNMSLLIAGRDRETLFNPYVWTTLMAHAKEDRDPGAGISEMSWDLSAARRPPVERQPEGSVNFGTADRPTLYAELAAVPADLYLGKPSTEFRVIVDSWALYEIENNRGYLKYGN